MATRIFFFLLGFGLMVIGFTYVIIYLNLLYLGYSWVEYLEYIVTRAECLFAVIGFMIMTLSIFMKGGAKHDLYL